jgi:hypothetical protein
MINGPSSSLVCADEKDFLLGIKLYPADKHDKRKLLNNQSTQHTDSYSISGLNKSGLPNAFIFDYLAIFFYHVYLQDIVLYPEENPFHQHRPKKKKAH